MRKLQRINWQRSFVRGAAFTSDWTGFANAADISGESSAIRRDAVSS